jgi:two-component system NarL family sensor kinase
MVTVHDPKACETSNPTSEMLENVRVDAVREERRRFANELHDVVASHLNAATLYLTAARQSLPPGEVRDMIDHAVSDVHECWSDARRCAKGLRPFGLMDRGLTTVISEYARDLSIASDVNVTFSCWGSVMPVSEDTKLAFVRVTQEAVTNAIRHAHATRVSVELQFAEDRIRLTVSDDGRGFDTARVSGGIGMSTMRDRAGQIGAELLIRRNPSGGTQIMLTRADQERSREKNRPD